MGGKFALLIGINKYLQPGNNLNGCVNDVNAVAEHLESRCGFSHDNIRMLCDERATQQNILERLSWLITDRVPGDLLVLHYSGHGSQVRDRDGDELNDRLDEIICPYDLDWDNPITDDVLASFFKKLANGVRLHFVADCCHSGTLNKGINNNSHPTANRFIAPPVDIAWRSRGRNMPIRKFGRKIGILNRDINENVHFIKQRHVLLSGCRDDQTSADAFIGGKYQGALTAALLDALEKGPRSWLPSHEGVLTWLKNSGFQQVPQLTGSEEELRGNVYM
jgi:hypothetical protein